MLKPNVKPNRVTRCGSPQILEVFMAMVRPPLPWKVQYARVTSAVRVGLANGRRINVETAFTELDQVPLAIASAKCWRRHCRSGRDCSAG